MIDAPHVTPTTAQYVACIHLVVPRAEIQNVMGPGLGEIMQALAVQGISPAGPWLTYHLRVPTETFDFKICVPIATPVRAVGRIELGEMPATTVARTTYHGPYEGLGAGWGEFMAWMEKEDLAPAGDLWECYVKGPESSPDSSAYRTELNRPLQLRA